MLVFTLIFLAALVATTGLRLWLARRQIQHVQAHRGTVPERFRETISLASHQKAADYTVAKGSLNMVHLLVEAGVLLALTLGGGLNALDQFWRGILPDSEVWRGLALIVSVVVITAVIDLPFSWRRTFGIEARFGFNRMTPKLFFVDLLKQTLLGTLIGVPLVLAALWMMQSLGARWWLWAWSAWMLFNVVMLAVYPTVIAPLFNKFTPLANAELKDRIERLLQRCGFEAKGLFVMDGSTRSSHGNAYFTGFGKTKRIVFFDTLLNSLNGSEIEAVLAHELGHFKRKHVIKRIALTFVMSFVFLLLLGYLMREPWFFSGLGVATPSSAMALVLFALVLPLFTFLLHPLSAMYSRKQEFEADEYAAQNANASDLVSALVKLYQDNASTLTPDPLHSAFYDSHPPAAMRIARLQTQA
jgi:STE24 endopeptidase